MRRLEREVRRPAEEVRRAEEEARRAKEEVRRLEEEVRRLEREVPPQWAVSLVGLVDMSAAMELVQTPTEMLHILDSHFERSVSVRRRGRRRRHAAASGCA